MALEELARNVTPEFESDLKWAGNSIYSGSYFALSARDGGLSRQTYSQRRMMRETGGKHARERQKVQGAPIPHHSQEGCQSRVACGSFI
ncbi:hypothetical protein AX14_003961 [Amanita brunnescens Koide BX004]|nr:hypothetical protein AX14_003961 [Amanita brunnescens Koide BX004]